MFKGVPIGGGPQQAPLQLTGAITIKSVLAESRVVAIRHRKDAFYLFPVTVSNCNCWSPSPLPLSGFLCSSLITL